VYDNEVFSEFIIGTWDLQESQPNSDYTLRELEFVDSENLIVDIDYPDGAHYNVIFQYGFTKQNTISVVGRTSDEWQIEKRGNTLVIHTASWPGNDAFLVYRRKTSVSWHLASYLGILTIYTYSVLLKVKRKIVMTKALKKDLGFPKSTFGLIGYCLLFLFGVLVGIIAWSYPPLLRVRLPWDSILMLELSILILIIRVLITRTDFFSLNARGYSNQRLSDILGYFLLGFGFCGLGISLVKLSLFLVYRSYLA
jgi:hypothetical protein